MRQFRLRLKQLFLPFLFLIVECLMLDSSLKGDTCHTIDEATLVKGTDEIYLELEKIGYQQCVRECIKSAKCGRIFYRRTHLLCGLITTPSPDIPVPDYLGACFEMCPPGLSCVLLTTSQFALCIEESPPLPCKIGDLHLAGICYSFGTRYSTWADANGICQSMNGHLATINTDAVNSLLTTKLKSLENSTLHFIGAFTSDIMADWRWTENEKLLNDCDFVNWGSTYPISQEDRLCGTLTPEGDWINMECFTKENLSVSTLNDLFLIRPFLRVNVLKKYLKDPL